MKTASKVFYTIGRIFNILGLVVALIALVFGILTLTNAPSIAEQAAQQGFTGLDGANEVKAFGTVFLTASVIAFVVTLVVFILATYASKALNNDKRQSAPHIIMIVIGIFGDLFYLLGGIFGLIEENANETLR